MRSRVFRSCAGPAAATRGRRWCSLRRCRDRRRTRAFDGSRAFGERGRPDRLGRRTPRPLEPLELVPCLTEARHRPLDSGARTGDLGLNGRSVLFEAIGRSLRRAGAHQVTCDLRPLQRRLLVEGGERRGVLGSGLGQCLPRVGERWPDELTDRWIRLDLGEQAVSALRNTDRGRACARVQGEANDDHQGAPQQRTPPSARVTKQVHPRNPARRQHAAYQATLASRRQATSQPEQTPHTDAAGRVR
jgi:hypothetical protein